MSKPMNKPVRDPALAHALDLLERIPLIDGHNDLPWVIHSDEQARGDVAAWDPSRLRQDHDTDIPRLREGKVSAQWWAAFLPTLSEHPGRTTMELIDVIIRLTEGYPDTFLPARRASDIARAKAQGKIASFIAVEGGVGLENSLSPLRVWHAAGARLMTLCHNETLDWVDSATDAPRHGGLTAFGRQVVLELNRLGMIVDLAHVSHDVMRQVLDITRAPVVWSHSNAFSLCNHPRNVPDDVLARVKANGGIVMATFVPTFINQAMRDCTAPSATTGARRWSCRLSARRRCSPPAARRRSRRSTNLSCTSNTSPTGRASPMSASGPTSSAGERRTGLEHVGRFPHLIAALVKRGWSDDALAGIASRNFVRVFRTVERVGKALRATETPRVGRIEDFEPPRV